MTSTHGASRRRTTTLVAGATAAGLAAGLLAVAAPAAQAAITVSDPNPNLAQSCGLDVVLVLDESKSMSGSTTQVRSSAQAMLDALQDTNSRVGIVTFTRTATTRAALTPDSVATNHGGVLGNAIAAYSPTASATAQTNWDDALRVTQDVFAAAPARSNPKLIIFVGDGQPNVYNTSVVNGVPVTSAQRAVGQDIDAFINPAIDKTNTFKAAGGHVLGVLLGTTVLPSGVANVSRLSQKYFANPQYTSTVDYNANVDGNAAAWDNDALNSLHNAGPLDPAYDANVSIPAAGAFSAATTDFMVQPSTGTLSASLRSLASFSCSRALTVTERSTTPASPVAVTSGGAGWAVSATVASDPTWTLPSGASGVTASTATDVSGTAVFQWATNGAQQPTIAVTPRVNYSLRSVTCTIDGVSAGAVTQGWTFQLPAALSGTQAANCVITTKYTGLPASFVSISPTSRVIYYGGTQRLVGQVRTPSTRYAGVLLPVAGAYVNVQSRPAWQTSAKWTSVGRVRTSSTGVYSIYVKPTYNRVYRVVYGGSTKVLPGFSRVSLIRVAPKLTSSFRITTTRLALSGTVRPVSAGQDIWLEKLVGRTWKVIATKKITSTGTYSFTWVKPSARAYYRIVKPGTTYYAASATPRYLG